MSGYKNKVKYSLDTNISNSSKKDNIGNIILPFEYIINMRFLNKILIEKVYIFGFPGICYN